MSHFLCLLLRLRGLLGGIRNRAHAVKGILALLHLVYPTDQLDHASPLVGISQVARESAPTREGEVAVQEIQCEHALGRVLRRSIRKGHGEEEAAKGPAVRLLGHRALARRVVELRRLVGRRRVALRPLLHLERFYRACHHLPGRRGGAPVRQRRFDGLAVHCGQPLAGHAAPGLPTARCGGASARRRAARPCLDALDVVAERPIVQRQQKQRFGLMRLHALLREGQQPHDTGVVHLAERAHLVLHLLVQLLALNDHALQGEAALLGGYSARRRRHASLALLHDGDVGEAAFGQVRRLSNVALLSKAGVEPSMSRRARVASRTSRPACKTRGQVGPRH
eukprot:scaffold1295_cov220-Pinguiococcus_pyrenoidosus.AAC.9